MKEKKGNTRWVMSTVCVLFTAFTIWFAFFFMSVSTDVFGADEINDNTVTLFSYKANTRQYKATIPGLKYDNKHVSEVKSPDFFRLGDLMTNWNPDVTDPKGWIDSPAHPNKGKGVARFDYSNSAQRKMALAYRNAEIPFIIYNIPDMETGAATTFTASNLIQKFGSVPRMVERSANNHFMYYRVQDMLSVASEYPSWMPPQVDMPMTFSKFLREAEQSEADGHVAGYKPLHYMTIAANTGTKMDWVMRGLPFFEGKESFFIVDPRGYMGVNCRFGMKGVVAASHYDGRRNFVAMLRGRKRYVLLPPSECSQLDLYATGHPSARHSKVDWSNITELAQHEDVYNAKATEVMVSMGEMLYIPSYWFHYIISQDASIQCNARSGDSLVGREAIEACGFQKDQYKKKGGGGGGKKGYRDSGNLRGDMAELPPQFQNLGRQHVAQPPDMMDGGGGGGRGRRGDREGGEGGPPEGGRGRRRPEDDAHPDGRRGRPDGEGRRGRPDGEGPEGGRRGRPDGEGRRGRDGMEGGPPEGGMRRGRDGGEGGPEGGGGGRRGRKHRGEDGMDGGMPDGLVHRGERGFRGEAPPSD